MTGPGKRRHNRANRTIANEKNSPKQNVSVTDSNTSTDQSQGVLSIVVFKIHSFFTMLYLMVLSAKRFMCRAIVTVCGMLLWPFFSVLKWIKGDDLESDVENPVNEYRTANKSREYQLRIQQLEKQIKEQQREISRCNNEVERLYRELKDQEEKYNHEIACKAEEVEKVKSNHKVEINNFIRAKNALKEELEAERKERESLSYRLSKLLSNQLTNNNPNIADLSDMNRPTKLTEKFSELYDNEWTNAFAVVEKRLEEAETIAILLNILKHCFTKCRQYAKNQLDAAKLKTAEIKQAKDELKKTAHLTLPLINELIDNSIQGTPDQAFYDDKTVLTYVRRCTELCWYMAVQDPPMALAVPEDKEYNKAYYREYTNSGKFVKYVVWPAILIQDGGDRMTKGIVQCCDSLKDPQLPVADQQ